METRSHHRRSDVAPCASLFLPLSPRSKQEKASVLGRQGSSDLLHAGKKEVAQWLDDPLA